ncbi:hypothetical protein AVEN_105088-1 [Araneus ventricosus]|uniref:Uncharacterized protein n=1 Tax=Araneus ventricosus TaxID=182803 RepID=A0A4Y2GS42_ARAVE|nr:hypothetical protein AVEN_105088-1 [Araneus ventricosus]
MGRFLCEKTVTGASYPDMLQFWLFPQMADDSGMSSNRTRLPLYWKIHVRRYPNDELPYRWIGGENTSLFSRSPRPPDLTLVYFFLGILRTLFVLLLPKTLEKAGKDPYCNDEIDRMKLQNVWNEFDSAWTCVVRPSDNRIF